MLIEDMLRCDYTKVLFKVLQKINETHLELRLVNIVAQAVCFNRY